MTDSHKQFAWDMRAHAPLDESAFQAARARMGTSTDLQDRMLYQSILAYVDAAKPVSVDAAFQQRVQPWMLECFGPEISADVTERCHRLFEEAGEACQSKGMTRSEAHQLVDYTWDRPIGDPYQEVGGVMVTLAAFCLAAGIDMHAAGETELARIWTKVEAIRAKQAAKPKHSPLPEHVIPSGDDESFTGRIRRTRLTRPTESTGEPQ